MWGNDAWNKEAEKFSVWCKTVDYIIHIACLYAVYLPYVYIRKHAFHIACKYSFLEQEREPNVYIFTISKNRE